MIRIRVLVPAVLLLAGCPDKPREDDGLRAKLANDLVQCKNDFAAQKEKMAELQAEVQKLKAAAVVQVDPIELVGSTPKAPHAKAPVHKEGNIPAAKLSEVIRKNSPGLRICYERALKRMPNLQYVSSVNVRFQVKNTGETMDIGFSPHTDAEMEKCMSAAIAKWRFPNFEGDAVQVEAPVNLVAR